MEKKMSRVAGGIVFSWEVRREKGSLEGHFLGKDREVDD